jgi:hypothetical protein
MLEENLSGNLQEEIRDRKEQVRFAWGGGGEGKIGTKPVSSCAQDSGDVDGDYRLEMRDVNQNIILWYSGFWSQIFGYRHPLPKCLRVRIRS